MISINSIPNNIFNFSSIENRIERKLEYSINFFSVLKLKLKLITFFFGFWVCFIGTHEGQDLVPSLKKIIKTNNFNKYIFFASLKCLLRAYLMFSK